MNELAHNSPGNGKYMTAEFDGLGKGFFKKLKKMVTPPKAVRKALAPVIKAVTPSAAIKKAFTPSAAIKKAFTPSAALKKSIPLLKLSPKTAVKKIDLGIKRIKKANLLELVVKGPWAVADPKVDKIFKKLQPIMLQAVAMIPAVGPIMADVMSVAYDALEQQELARGASEADAADAAFEGAAEEGARYASEQLEAAGFKAPVAKTTEAGINPLILVGIGAAIIYFWKRKK